jgi:hypothetical protein
MRGAFSLSTSRTPRLVMEIGQFWEGQRMFSSVMCDVGLVNVVDAYNYTGDGFRAGVSQARHMRAQQQRTTTK